MKKIGYLIVNSDGKHMDGRIWKDDRQAQHHINAIIKNNSLEQRKMTGYMGLHTKRYELNQRETKEMENAKNFIMR